MSTRGTAVIKDERTNRVACLYQHHSANPEGMAATLLGALDAAHQTEPVDLMAAVLPDGRPCFDYLELDENPHWHSDTSFRYDITQTAEGTQIVVNDMALDLSQPEDFSVLRFKYLKDGDAQVFVPIFEGSLEEFFRWSASYDEESDEAIIKLIEASRSFQKGG